MLICSLLEVKLIDVFLHADFSQKPESTSKRVKHLNDVLTILVSSAYFLL